MMVNCMLAAERLEAIAGLITEKGAVEVEDLAKMMDVSPMTIRRDLKHLCEAGRAERHYGGARLPQYIKAETDYESKKTQNCEAKRRIAQKAVSLIQPNDTIFLDGGTTTGEIARLLCGMGKGLAVVTNDLNIAILLSDSDVDLTMIGGVVQKSTRCVMGHASEHWLKQFRLSKAFVGASSIDHQFDVFSPTYDKAYLKRAIMEVSAQPYLVVDATKFSSQAMCAVCPLNRFAGVVTNKVFTPGELKRLEELDVTLIDADSP